MDAVIGNVHHRNNAGEEFYLAGAVAIGFLHQVFLCFALIGRLLVFRLFQLFHQVTMPVAMQPGFVPVLAKFGGNVIFVQLKTSVDKKAREAAANDADDN